MEDYLEFAKNIAFEAGRIMLKHFKVGVDYTEKHDLSIVTAADQEINQFLIDKVNEIFPEHSVLGEEKSDIKISNKIWVCDPIDGTVPYSKGLPISVFSLAYVEDGTPLLGVVYDPFMQRLYYATKGGGAFVNEKKLKVSQSKLDRRATLDIEWWPEAEYDVDSAYHRLSVSTGAYVLHLGSVIQAACLVASGQLEACAFAGTIGKNVDIAAIKVIVEEAGGKVTDLFGQEQRYDQDIKGAIISNSLTHSELCKLLSNQ